MEILTALDAVREAPSILEGIRRADDLSAAAAAVGRAHGVRRLAEAASDPDDQLTAIAAVHALAHVPSGSADPALVSLLSHDALHLREHAAWALGARAPQPGAIGALIGNGRRRRVRRHARPADRGGVERDGARPDRSRP